MSYALIRQNEKSGYRTDQEPVFYVESNASYVIDKKIVLDDLNNQKYVLKKPISVTIEVLADDEYLASCDDVGISFSGNTATEALREWEIELVEIYELYKSEKHLGPWPKQQLAVLETYLGKRT